MTTNKNMPKLIEITLFLSFILSSCYNLDLGTGESTQIKEQPNRVKIKKAVLLENSGNATVDNSLQVSILDYPDKVSNKELGNTFTVDRNHGATTLDASSVSFHWLSNDTLQIDYDGKLRTFIQHPKVNGVTVLYKAR
jgi:hypothetical protein